MRRTIVLLIATFAASLARAHPSVSVVIDSRGNVFYSDLKNVWMIAPDGSRSIAVPGVHTHELALDAGGNLYGEHLWYEGEAIDKWGHYVWRRAPGGKVDLIKPRTEGFLKNYSFVRDRAGSQYWIDRSRNAVMKRLPDSRLVTIARGTFRDVRWSTVTGGGTFYFVDVHDLVRVTPAGQLSTVARDLSPWHVDILPPRGVHHELMGLWTDPAGNVYVAHPKKSEVKRISRAGEVSVVARSSLGWSPTGGAFAPNGDLWILESGPLSRVRMRRIARNGREAVFRSSQP